LDNYNLLGYGGASLGIIFFIIAVITRTYSVTKQSTNTLTITYPYQFLSAPYLIIGIIFVATGISGFWLSYYKFEKPLKLVTIGKTMEKTATKPIIEQKAQELTEPTNKQESDEPKNSTTFSFTYGLETRAPPPPPPPPPRANELTDQQRRQVQLETIWLHEKTVPKLLRGTWQAKLSFNKLEKGLTESEKQYLKKRRETE
jgi:hypothetical protein